MKPLFTQILSMQDIILADTPRGSEPADPRPEPAAQVWCTNCGGSGETHSAYSDNTCPACDGVGKRPANWREMMED